MTVTADDGMDARYTGRGAPLPERGEIPAEARDALENLGKEGT